MSNPWVNEEDGQDFEQEKQILLWAEAAGIGEQFNFQHISRKGTARNTLIKAQIRLDQKITYDSSGTFANFVSGSDGRDLYSGGDHFEPGEMIDAYLYFLGFDEEFTQWLIKMSKSSPNLERSPSETSVIDLESFRLFNRFRK